MKIYFFASAEKKKDLASKIISSWIKADFSHVGHIIDFADGSEPRIYHATGEGFNEIPLFDFLRNHIFTHRFDITPYLTVSPEAVHWYLIGNLGKDYSELQFVGFLPKWIPKFIHRWFKKLAGDGRSELICSEITTRTANDCTKLKIKGDPDFIDPKEFINQILTYGLPNLAMGNLK